MTETTVICSAPDDEPVTVHTTIHAAGTVVYQLTGARLHGAVRIEPDVPDTAPLPSHLRVRFGTDPLTCTADPPDRPVVDGVTAGGWGRAPLHAAAGRPTFAIHGTAPGPDGAWHYAPLPHESKRYLHGVLDALAAQYQTLDVDVFALAAARATAGRRLSRLTQGTILPTALLLADVTEALTDAQAAAALLQELSPLRLLPTPAPAHWHRLPDADPETHVTATDDGDWLTCTTCGTCTVLIEPGTTLLRLVQAHTAHRCLPPPLGTTGQPHPRHT